MLYLLKISSFINRYSIIAFISTLLVFFVVLYFIRQRAMRRARGESGENTPSNDSIPNRDVLDSYHIISTQFELMSAWSEIGTLTIIPDEKIICNENAALLLSLDCDFLSEEDNSVALPLHIFMELIHESSRDLLLRLIDDAQTTKNLDAIDSPFIMQIRGANGYHECLFRFRALYNQSAQLYAIAGVFASSSDIARKNI